MHKDWKIDFFVNFFKNCPKDRVLVKKCYKMPKLAFLGYFRRFALFLTLQGHFCSKTGQNWPFWAIFAFFALILTLQGHFCSKTGQNWPFWAILALFAWILTLQGHFCSKTVKNRLKRPFWAILALFDQKSILKK